MLCVVLFLSKAVFAQSKEQKPLIAVSVRPLALLVQDLCQALCVAEAIIPAGVSEHHWNPSAKDILKFEGAMTFVGVGLGFDEKIIASARPKRTKKPATFYFGESVAPLKWLENDKAGAHHDHDHGTWDPHVWFDPSRMSKAVNLIANHLVQQMPLQESVLRTQEASLVAVLTQLDKETITLSQSWSKKYVIVLHDSFRYWSEHYKQNTKALMTGASGHEASAKSFGVLTRQLKGESVVAVAVEREDGAAKNLARTLKTKVSVLDVAANLDKTTYESWFRAFARSWDQMMR